MDKLLVAAVIFYAIYQVLKNFTDFFLKRMIIKTGHFDNAGILEQKVSSVSSDDREVNKYPSLKWGLVAFFAGLGFIVIDQLSPGMSNHDNYRNFVNDSMLPFGIELVSISFGFIVYFLIVNFSKKR
ncbi:MAG TPA: hypothetical protein VGK38_13400 [Prolixibacteraceae bacterium]|jgi:hypothetical protein